MSRTYQPPHFSATFTAISWRLGGRIGQLLLFILAGSFSTFHVEAPLVTAAEVTHRLAPAPKTVTWGYFDPQTPPALRIASGDTVEIEALVAAAVEDLEFAGVPADQIQPAVREIGREVEDRGGIPPLRTGRISSGPPWVHTGNMDNKELVAGTTLYMPLHVKGALLSVGDGHAGQGDGEVCVTALETSLRGTFQLLVRKDMKLRWPRAETPTHFMTMGFHENLEDATKIAVNEMLDFLVSEKHLSRDNAYVLASDAVDLQITQLVDGKRGVHALLPKAIFLH